MIDYENTVENSRLKRSPWISPPSHKQSYDCNAEINEWLEEDQHDKLYLFEISGNAFSPVAILTNPVDDHFDSNVRDMFRELVSQWKDETWFISSIKKRIAHPAYLKIIGLGKPAVPLILEELWREPDYWSYALEAITREDPSPKADNLKQLRDAWLAWGRGHGY